MSILGHQSLINTKDAFWLSSIANDVIHSTIQVQELDASVGRFSTLFADTLNASTINVSSLSQENADVSGMYVSSIRGNTAFFSTMTLASDLSGGVGYVRFSVDASGIQVDGDPIRFDNLVYLTSSINIVQVSTIVDTDIFAQRGFFSTLSTGVLDSQQNYLSSIVFNDMSGNTGSMKRLVVSSIIAGDISGVDLASSWSLYPTLNSSIIFQPSYVLSNVGPSLYFAGVELTDVSGGGQDWARFPAVSTVQMANNSLTGLSTLQFQDNAKFYSLTGNNLFYNGQPIAYGSAGFASNWANYPAVANVNVGNSTLFGASLIQGSNMTLSGSNITSGNTFTNSLGVGGTSLLSLATINSLGQGVLQDLDVGNSTTSIGDLNVYGVNAVPGDNALYVIGGTTLTGGLTAGVPVHGTEIGALPVAGVDTVRIDVLPAGMGLNSATYIQLACVGAGSFASGGALSLAGGDYVEINTDDLRVINTTSGNQSTTLTVANIQMPASVASTVPLQINNTAGGGINLVGSAGVGQIANFSSISGNNLIAGSSTITNTLYVPGNAYAGFMAWNNGLGISTTIGALRVNNIQIPDNITGLTNAPAPLQSRIENFSSIQSGTLSCINLAVSTVNGLPWDISGNDPLNNNYSTLTTSSFQVSSISGIPNNPFGSSINVNAGLQFTGTGAGTAGGRYISSLLFMNNIGQNFFHEFSTASFSYLGGINPNGYMRLGNGGAYDTFIKNFQNEPCISTSAILTSSIVAQNGLDISGAVNINNTINVPLAGGSITFDDGSFVNYTRLEFNDCANQGTLVAVNNGVDGDGSNCAEIAGLGFRLVAGTGLFEGVHLYTQFPGTGWGLDQLDTNGNTAWEYMYGEETPTDGYITVINGISSFSGTTDLVIGISSQTTHFYETLTGPILSSLALNVSSINGAPPGSGGGGNQFSTLGTSSFTFSTATSVGSNTLFNYPVFLDYDQATNISTGGVAIAVQGHNLATGAVVNRIEMGARGNGENYIMSIWPGQNLEDLYIDTTELLIRDGTFSTIINSDPYGLITNGGISAPSLLVSSINGLNSQVAYTNNLCLSSMTLYQNSTTLLAWSTITTSSNINTSGYDVTVGQNGIYKFGVSLQFDNQSGNDVVEYFFVKNDVVVDYSATITTVPNNTEHTAYTEIIEPMANGDKIQIGLYTTEADVYVSTIQGNVAISPGAILTAYKIA